MQGKISEVKLIEDRYNGDGDVLFPPEWCGEDDLLKLDILKDWIGVLETMYNETFEAWHGEMEDKCNK